MRQASLPPSPDSFLRTSEKAGLSSGLLFLHSTCLHRAIAAHRRHAARHGSAHAAPAVFRIRARCDKHDAEHEMEPLVRGVDLNEAQDRRGHEEAEEGDDEVDGAEDLEGERRLLRSHKGDRKEDDTDDKVHDVVRKVRVEERAFADERIPDEAEKSHDDEYYAEHGREHFSHSFYYSRGPISGAQPDKYSFPYSRLRAREDR